MKKLFSALVLCVLFSSVSFAQNWYASTSFGFDFSLNNGEAANQTINAQVGYFFDNNQGFELDYSHGFQKDFVNYNRIGVNYICEFNVPNEVAFVPYIKLGAAYKNYGIKAYGDDFHEDFADFKGGLGVHCYLSSNVSINFGVDFTNSINDDVEFEWRNTMMQLNIGLSYNF